MQSFPPGSFPDKFSPAIDLSPVLEECMGNRDLLGELLAQHHLNALEFIGAAKIHLHHCDFKALGLAARKIQAGLIMMRTDSLHTIVALVQRECEGDKDLKHLRFLYDCFAAEYPTVKYSIDLAVENIKIK